MDVVVSGGAGTAGANGTGLGGTGQAGETAPEANATNTSSTDLTNTARAYGGEGGKGGNGAYAGRFTPGGAAGAGGAGGAAYADVATIANAASQGFAYGTAVGGNGGGSGYAAGPIFGAVAPGGAGGAADVISYAANVGAGGAKATGFSTGGSGGIGYGGGFGGEGGAATGSATVNPGVGKGYAYVKATGGYGGVGDGGNGGEGGTATLENAVVGVTNGGYLVLKQKAVGGSGGQFVKVIGFGGAAAGAAYATQSLDDTTSVTQSAQIVAKNYAIGGHGGASFSPYGGGVSGGYALATSNIKGAVGSGAVLISLASAVGGYGGNQGGAGGVAKASAVGVSTGSGDVTVTAIQDGGVGGFSFRVNGGAGASSSLYDAATGSTNGGQLTLHQYAAGGAGGYSQGPGGAGGAAYSGMNFDDADSVTQSAQVTALLSATGGAGGTGTLGSAGGAGAQGYSNLVLAGGAVTAASTATGGAGGAGATMGTPGPGHALLTATGTDVTAATTAHGGQGASRAGHGKAKSVTTGTSGTFTDNADTSLAAGALVTAVSASATGAVDGKQTGKAKVVLGQTAQPFSAFGQATADASGAPDPSSSGAVLAANSNIAAAFGGSPVFFAIDELGGQYAKSGGTGPESSTETVNLTVDLTKLASEQDLMVGFYDGTALGAGFTSLTLTITADGSVTPLLTRTFITLASAESFFTDNAVDLGTLGTGALAGSTLNLTATMSITAANSGDGFYASLIVGDPPSASASHRFVDAMAGLGGSGVSMPPSALGSPINPPLLAAGLGAMGRV